MLCRQPDNLTLCPTRRELQNNVCHEFAYEDGVIFNPTKTVYTLFGYKTIPYGIGMYRSGERLGWVDSIRQQGNIATPHLKDDLNI